MFFFGGGEGGTLYSQVLQSSHCQAVIAILIVVVSQLSAGFTSRDQSPYSVGHTCGHCYLVYLLSFPGNMLPARHFAYIFERLLSHRRYFSTFSQLIRLRLFVRLIYFVRVTLLRQFSCYNVHTSYRLISHSSRVIPMVISQ